MRRSCFPGTLRSVTVATMYLLWQCCVQTIRKTPQTKRHTGRKRRDKEALKRREWQGGRGPLRCQLCFKHLQKAEESWADVFALTYVTRPHDLTVNVRWDMWAGEFFISGYFLNLDMWNDDGKADRGREEDGSSALSWPWGVCSSSVLHSRGVQSHDSDSSHIWCFKKNHSWVSKHQH